MRATWILVLMMGLAAASAAAEPAATEIVVHSTKGEFGDVKDRVLMGIENRGMVLSGTAHVGDMLERTGKDLGRMRRIYSHADVLEFCNAVLSRDTMEADPHNIVFCPYTIAVYALPNEPGKVYLSYRKPAAGGSAASIKALAAVEKLLEAIVREARN
jgi:uncharacterized protein (DUF302 family)